MGFLTLETCNREHWPFISTTDIWDLKSLACLRGNFFFLKVEVAHVNKSFFFLSVWPLSFGKAVALWLPPHTSKASYLPYFAFHVSFDVWYFCPLVDPKLFISSPRSRFAFTLLLPSPWMFVFLRVMCAPTVGERQRLSDCLCSSVQAFFFNLEFHCHVLHLHSLSLFNLPENKTGLKYFFIDTSFFFFCIEYRGWIRH